MNNQKTVICVFCRGLGNNPHFRGTCPVCKGRGKNEVVGKYMTCSSCRGLGQKKGTTLTCYDCGGLGVLPDTREIFRKAREEIGQVQKEMAGEREELTEKRVVNGIPVGTRLGTERKDKENEWEEEKEEETGEKTHFCQCCGDKVNESIPIKICFDCFNKVKGSRVYKEI